jgi:hypothetical protein
MKLREVLDLVVGSPKERWHHVLPHKSASATHVPIEQNGARSDHGTSGIDIKAHDSLVVHAEHPEVSLAWGFQLEDDLTVDALAFSHGPVSSVAADVMLNGMLVHRERVLLVDGEGGYLPMPHALFVEPDASVMTGVIHTVTQWQHDFVALLDVLTGQSQYDHYFQMSGFDVVPGHPLGAPTQTDSAPRRFRRISRHP